MIEVVEAKDEAHKEEVEILNNTHDSELTSRDELLEVYLETVKRIENKSKSYTIKLREEEKARVREIIEKAKGDKNEIKTKIEDLFGITYTD